MQERVGAAFVDGFEEDAHERRGSWQEDGKIWYSDGNPGGWHRVVGTAIDIGVGANGHIWVINTHGWIYRRHHNPNDGWENMDWKAVRIDVDPEGLAWIVQADGEIWNSGPGGWDRMPGLATDIGVGADGNVWVTGRSDGAIHRWNADKADWDRRNLNATQITVDEGGTPWVVQESTQIWTGTPQ